MRTPQNLSESLLLCCGQQYTNSKDKVRVSRTCKHMHSLVEERLHQNSGAVKNHEKNWQIFFNKRMFIFG